MNNGFDYITSGNYAGDWLQIQFLAETVATLTPHTGDSVTGTFAAGQQLVGTFVEVNVTSGVMLAYRRGTTAKRLLGLLDTYGGAAAAYSLRKLRAAYSGSAIRVRESGSNTEADIGFNADGTLNTTALLAHCGANNGFVTTWYDQSGNARNAAQASAAAQPQIVSSGNVILENGKPCLDFNGTSHVLLTNEYIVELSQNPASVFALSAQISLGVGSRILNEADVASPFSSNFIIGGDGSPTGKVLWVNGTTFGTMPTGQSLVGFDYTGSVFQAHANGAASGASGAATVNPEVLNTASIGGGVVSAGGFMNGTIQEIITYKFDNSSNRTAIESNINAHYNIY